MGVDDDHRSVGSRSMSSRSVSDRSYAERSKAEESLAKKAKERRSKRGKALHHGDDDQSLAMRSIDETSVTDFMFEDSPKKPNSSQSPVVVAAASAIAEQERKGFLGLFLDQKGNTDTSTSEDDTTMKDENGDSCRDLQSVISASTLGSKSIVSALSKAEQSMAEQHLKEKKKIRNSSSKKEADAAVKNEDNNDLEDDLGASLNLEDIGTVVTKQLRFRDGDSERYISQELTNSMYDDLFWTSEELADFRYEAFLEEAGLDVNEYM